MGVILRALIVAVALSSAGLASEKEQLTEIEYLKVQNLSLRMDKVKAEWERLQGEQLKLDQEIREAHKFVAGDILDKDGKTILRVQKKK